MNTGLDRIDIKNLEVFAYHGVEEQEKINGQKFYVDAALALDVVAPGNSDDLEDTVNYAAVCACINEFMTENRFDLIEAAAYKCARNIMKKFPKIREIDMTVHKPHAPIGLPFGDVSVTVSLKWHRAYLSIGSNIGDSEAYLNQAVDSLYDDDACRVLRVSDYVVTKPYGPVKQDDFLNGCVEVETLYSPRELLAAVNKIEQEAGRTREVHWGPRTLDVDIVLYDDITMFENDLIIPHMEMHKRLFVLVPLAQIAPYAFNPVYNKSVQQLLDELVEKEENNSGVKTACRAGCSGCPKIN